MHLDSRYRDFKQAIAALVLLSGAVQVLLHVQSVCQQLRMSVHPPIHSQELWIEHQQLIKTSEQHWEWGRVRAPKRRRASR